MNRPFKFISHKKYTAQLIAVFLLLCGLTLITEAADDIGYPEPNPEKFPTHLIAPDPSQSAIPSKQAASQFYVTGDITPDEQQYLEYINRARKDPNAEGRWLQGLTDPEIKVALDNFNTDLDELFTDEDHGFQTFEPLPPLAPNPIVRVAAEVHTMDMFENTYQRHVNLSGENPGDRITAAGYTWRTYGENIFVSSKSNLYGHAGFQIDWGLGGIQDPPGHRLAIHNANYNEIGIFVFHGSKKKIEDGNPIRKNVGPQLVTQVFATDRDRSSFLTGVAYYDLNGNAFYDTGEEIPGLRVATQQGNFYTEGAQSGGYSLPSEGPGQITVTFSDSNQTKEISGVQVENGINKKVDLVLPYSGSEITGPDNLSTLHEVSLSSSEIFGSDGYDWQMSKVTTGLFKQDAESGVVPFETDTSDGFNIITSKIFSQGSRSFHLFHNTNPPVDQNLIWNGGFHLSETSQITFQSRHAVANSTQIAFLEMREFSSNDWQSLWSDEGSGSPGETSFQSVTIPLSEYAGKTVAFRFSYKFQGGTFFHGIGNPDPFGLGWYIDNIQILNSEKYILQDSGTSSDPDDSFEVKPLSVGTYSVVTRPLLGDNSLPWGQELRLDAIAENVDQSGGGDATFNLLSASFLNPQTLEIRVQVEGEVSGDIEIAVQSSDDVAGSFSSVVSGTSIRNISGDIYAVSIPVDEAKDKSFFILSSD